MDVTGGNANPASFPGDEAGTSVSLDAGSYSVGETGPSGYTRSDSADCSGTIALGETKTCTVTNDDVAQVQSQITPTATTCSQFNAGTSATLDTLNYSVKTTNGVTKISQVDPGVFFYWIKVDAVAGANSFTIDQDITSGNFDHLLRQGSRAARSGRRVA